MSKNHCDWISIEKAYCILESLNITKKQFSLFCGLSPRTLNQFRNWEKKGKMPAFRLSVLENSLRKQAEKKYADSIKKINELFSSNG